MRTTSKILLGFFLAIIVGSGLLTLPIATVSGESNYLTALFTATTSVCVTGLVVVPTFSYWSLFGKIVILILIQLGGLGIVALTSFVMLILNRKFTLRNRMMIQDSFGLSNMQGMVIFVKRVMLGTLTVEAIGACLYMIVLIPEFGVPRGIWYSCFNAISAFCNAGIDIIGPDSLMNYANSPLMLLISAFLIIFGGIGFIVWWDIIDVFRKIKNHEIRLTDTWKYLRTHTKIVLVMTISLLLSGTILTFIFEYQNPETIGNMSLGEKLLNSFFQSVTFRTAGFASFSQKGLTDSSVLVGCLLMLTGGSPVGTAGGIKTVTVAVLVFSVLSVIKGRNDTIVFKKTIPIGLVRRALAVTMISIGMLFVSTILLLLTNHLTLSDALYEVTSAIATVGLSRDVTPALNIFGQILIIICMYLGRVGPITMFIFFGQRANNKNAVKYADAEIIVG